MTPAVSVVVTTFDRPHYLLEAIRSALSQTFEDFEVLVCDDGAREDTRLICESFCDTRIRHVVNDSTLGIALNTYAGVMQARSDVIAFLNEDDRWTPRFLEVCAHPLLTEANTVLCFCDHWLIDEDGMRLLQETDTNSAQFGRSGLADGPVQTPLKLIVTNSIPLAMGSAFRKSAVDWGLFSRNVEGAYDYFLSYCLIRSGGEVFYVSERLTEYRVHDSSASAKFNLTNSSGAAYVHGLILKDTRFLPVIRDIQLQAAGLERHMAKLYLRRLKIVSAASHLQKSFGYHFSRVLRWRAR